MLCPNDHETSPWVCGATVLRLVFTLVPGRLVSRSAAAIGCQVIVACLVPSWAQLDVAESLWLDCRIAATVFGLVGLLLPRQGNFPWKLGWLDAAMISLLVIHVVSDVENTGCSWAIPFRVYGEWCVAYLAGRLALQALERFSVSDAVAIIVAVIMALGSTFEAVSGDHPWKPCTAKESNDGIDRNATRWGLTRAWGCCAHPIYFGFVQVLFLPWLIASLHRTLGRPSWSRRMVSCLPLLGVVGVFCTGSRSALGAYLAVMFLGLLAYVPRTRIIFFWLLLWPRPLAYMKRADLVDTVTRLGETVNEKTEKSRSMGANSR